MMVSSLPTTTFPATGTATTATATADRRDAGMQAQTSTGELGRNLTLVTKVCGDPLRMQVLRVLRDHTFSVLELCRILSMRQPALSHHLKLLTRAGLTEARRQGSFIFHRRASEPLDPALTTLHQTLMSTIDRLPLPTMLESKIQEVLKERRQVLRRLHPEPELEAPGHHDFSGYKLYLQSVLELLENHHGAMNLALEIGPGNGRFLPALAKRFKEVVAVDVSMQMLDLARQYATSRQLQNIRFQQLDIHHPLPGPAVADCVVVNMVLHHVSSPGEALEHLARRLRPGGSLLLSELCPHPHAWTREICGDLWLGLDPDSLGRWAEAAALVEKGEGTYQELGAGLRYQARHFVKQEQS